MCYETRCFLVDGEAINMLSRERLDSILELKEALPKFSGQSVKTLHLVVRAENEKAMDIKSSQGFIYYFNAEGYYDYDFSKDQRKLMFSAIAKAEAKKADQESINAEILAAKKEFDDTFTWQPDDRILGEAKKALGLV